MSHVALFHCYELSIFRAVGESVDIFCLIVVNGSLRVYNRLNSQTPRLTFPCLLSFLSTLSPLSFLFFHSHQLVPNLRSWQILEEQQTNQKYKNNTLTNFCILNSMCAFLCLESFQFSVRDFWWGMNSVVVLSLLPHPGVSPHAGRY